jgi:hypothetical protein
VIPPLRGVRLLPALLVVFGTLLAAAPAQAADDDFALRGTYLRSASNGCDAGDLPTFGGHYSASGNPLLHWNPTKTGSTGSWESLADTTLNQDVVCLDFADPVDWRIVEETWTPGTSSGATATCPVGEYLIAGGFYLPSGLGGRTTANAPDGDRSWGVESGGDPRAVNTAYAVCAKLPAGFKTYSTSANRSDAGAVTATCAGDDLPITGGWDAAQVGASHPEAHGWTVKVGNGGGFARAVCLTGLEKRVETRIATASAPYLSAECADDEFAVNAGWDTGAGMASLRIFLAWNSDSNGWTIGSNDGDSSSALAYVLCGKVLPPPAPSWSAVRLPGAGALGAVALLGLGALLLGRGRLSGPIQAVVGTGASLAVIGAIIVALIPIEAGAVTPAGDSDTLAVPSGTPKSTASLSPSPSVSTSASATPTESPSSSPSASASSTSATPKPSAKPTPKKTTSSAAPAPAPVIDFRVSPTSQTRDCTNNAELAPFPITLDNSRSTVSVPWTGAVLVKDGTVWATLSNSGGSVPAHSTQQVTVVPKNPQACNLAAYGSNRHDEPPFWKVSDFHLRIDAGGTSYPLTVNIRWRPASS